MLLLAPFTFLCFFWRFLLGEKKNYEILAKNFFETQNKTHAFVEAEFIQWHGELSSFVSSEVMLVG